MLLEVGTRGPLAWCGGPSRETETEQAERLVAHLEPGMVLLADRYYCGFPLWLQAVASGAVLFRRVKSNMRIPALERFSDGSWRSVLAGSGKELRASRGAYSTRLFTSRFASGKEGLTPAMTPLDPSEAPAAELAPLLHERREIGTAFDEVKTRLFGPGALLRSKAPDLVRQELHGLMLAHRAVRRLIHEAAGRVGENPDRLSFLHAVNVV